MSTSSLHRESTNSLILTYMYTVVCALVKNLPPTFTCMLRVYTRHKEKYMHIRVQCVYIPYGTTCHN